VESRLPVPKAVPRVRSFGGRFHGRSRRFGELGELVSRGRIADVYEAHDRLLGRIVAIKLPAPAFACVRGLSEEFRRRARAAAHLN
jgi:hypothetical protein